MKKVTMFCAFACLSICLLVCSCSNDDSFSPTDSTLLGKWRVLEFEEVGVEGIQSLKGVIIEEYLPNGTMKRYFSDDSEQEAIIFNYTAEAGILQEYFNKDFIREYRYEIKGGKLKLNLIDVKSTELFCNVGTTTYLLLERVK